MKPLTVPPAAQRDENSIQMLSAWIAEQGQHCSIKIGFWHEQGHDERKIWGMFLADTVRHISDALQERFGLAAPETIATILSGLHEELGAPTTDASGEFSHGHH
jgi:uncharacterized protein DUF5076